MKKNGHFIILRGSVYLFAFFYTIAGINHFLSPHFYLGLIPTYLPYHEAINYLSGTVEIIIGLTAISHRSRKIAAGLAIITLIAFVPSHIHFIKIGSCVPDGLCVNAWIAWIRLLVVHPLLIAWAIIVGRINTEGLFLKKSNH